MTAKNQTPADSPASDCAAFPDPCAAHPGAFPPNEDKGMTLRDYFAAKAMAAMLTHDAQKNDWPDAKVAEWAYNAADAMMDFRQNRKRYAMTDFPPDHPCHMTAEDHKRVIQKHLGNGQASASSPCSPDNCVGSGDCVQCCPSCDSLRSYGYDDGPCDRHKHQTPNTKP